MQKVLSQGAFHKWAVSFFVFLRDLSCPHFCCCCSNWSVSVWRSEFFLEVSNPLHLPGIVLWKGDKLLHTRANGKFIRFTARTTGQVVSTRQRVVEWKCMALVHSSFRVESCLVVLSVLSLSCTRGQNYCWLDKITCRVFKCISLAKTITWQQDSRGPFLLGLIWTFSVLREGVLKWAPQKRKSSITFCHFGSFFCLRMEIGEWSTWPCSPAFITIRFSLLFASVSWMVVYL